jgi:hypothetical protein
MRRSGRPPSGEPAPRRAAPGVIMEPHRQDRDDLDFEAEPPKARTPWHTGPHAQEREGLNYRINIRTLLWVIFGAVLIGFMVWYVTT